MAVHATHGAGWAPPANPDSYALLSRPSKACWRALSGMVGGCYAARLVARNRHGGTHLKSVVQATDGRLANLGFIRPLQQGGFAR